MSTHLAVTTSGILAQQEKGGPLGPEFGKASPVGLLILIALLVVVIILGRSATKRIKNLNRRRAFAEKEGIDVFDAEEIDRRMAEKGIQDVNANSRFPEVRLKHKTRSTQSRSKKADGTTDK
jgi:hypothetical protein